jgi:hypothetical protein
VAFRSGLDRLRQKISGKLVAQSPLAESVEAPWSLYCVHIFKELKNPYCLGDKVGLTQSLGLDVETKRLRSDSRVDRPCRGGRQFACENNPRHK